MRNFAQMTRKVYGGGTVKSIAVVVSCCFIAKLRAVQYKVNKKVKDN